MQSRQEALLRERRRALRAGVCGLLFAFGLGAGPAHSAPETARERLGPLEVDSGARDQVRGGRPEGATLHDAHIAQPVEPEGAAREELADFEHSTFAARPTIVRDAPDPWIAALSPPDLPIRYDERLVEYLRFFKDDPRGQAIMRGWLRRMNRYDHILRPILKQVGVPQDLVFVAMAESGFVPQRRSRVGAAGLWQFMEPTGRVYGLEKDYWVDERYDIERSTFAAAAYLKDLRARFGSWEMALAAFNGGYGLVMTAIARANSNNFWALCDIESGLPHATTLYVPKILAAALVGRNRPAFQLGPDLADSLSPVHFVKVEVPPGTALVAVAHAIDEDPALIEELNAQLVRKRTPPGRTYPVRIPRDKLPVFHRSAAGFGKHAQHVVAYGETVTAIAQRHGTSEHELRRLNGIDDNAELERGLVLLVPQGQAAPIPAQKDRLLVPAPRLALGPDQRLVFFVVTRATTPRGLARAFSVPWDNIVAWNDLDPQARLQPGQALQVVVSRQWNAQTAQVVVHEQDAVDLVVRGSREHIEASLRQRGLARRGYRVRKGDTLVKIGKRFGLSDGDLARINGISRTSLPPPGQVLVVYVKAGDTRGTLDAPPPRGHEPAPAGLPRDLPADDDKPRSDPSTETTNALPGQRDATQDPPRPRRRRREG